MQTVALLAAALLLGFLSRRVGLPALVGELLAGVVLGPSILGWALPGVHTWLFPHGIASSTTLVAQAGVALMVGLAASELDGAFVRARTRTVSWVAGMSFLVPLALGVGIGMAAPDIAHGPHGSTTVFALLLGTALSVSAIPVIARILIDLGMLRTEIGQLILTTAALTDIGAWLLLAVASAMATTESVTHLAISVAALFAMIAFTCATRHRVAGGLAVVEARTTGAVRAVAVSGIAAAVIAVAAIMSNALHLEVVLGAFLGGLLIGHRRSESVRPLHLMSRWVLAPIFLATAGLHLDLRALGSGWVLAFGAVVLAAAVAGKLAGTYVGARMARVPHRDSLALGAGLNARGVVEIVIAGVGLRLGIFSGEVSTVIVLVALVTSLMAGPMLSWLYRGQQQQSPDIPDVPEPVGDPLESAELTPGR